MTRATKARLCGLFIVTCLIWVDVMLLHHYATRGPQVELQWEAWSEAVYPSIFMFATFWFAKRTVNEPDEHSEVLCNVAAIFAIWVSGYAMLRWSSAMSSVFKTIWGV